MAKTIVNLPNINNLEEVRRVLDRLITTINELVVQIEALEVRITNLES